MAILADANTRVMTQGFTGAPGTFHAEQGSPTAPLMQGRHAWAVMAARQHLEPAGVRHVWPGCVRATGADATVIIVRPPSAADAIRGRRSDVRGAADRSASTGGHSRARHGEGEAGALHLEIPPDRQPNCPGIITPEACKIGIMHRSASTDAGRWGSSRAPAPSPYRGPWRRHDRRRARRVQLRRHRRGSGEGDGFHRRAGAVPARTRRRNPSS